MAHQMEIGDPQLVKKEAVGDTKDCELNESDRCHSCLLSNKTVIAIRYCSECEEKLCYNCVKSHAKRKATSSHKPIPIDKMTTESNFYCSPCYDDDTLVKALTFCKACEEYLCSDCTCFHKNRKATKSHAPVAVEHWKDDQGAQSDEIVPLCGNCKYNGIDSRSVNYCKVCDEYLCESCTKSHRTRKATKSHGPVHISLLQQEEDEHENVNHGRKVCLPCLIIGINKAAKSFCSECEELLCTECTYHHRLKKLTKSHVLESLALIEHVTRFCDICDLKDKEAVLFCNTCEDALCQTCAQRHNKQRASKTHSTEAVKGKTMKKVKNCDPCIESDVKKRAETYSKACKEHYCETCTRRHINRKARNQQELTNLASDNSEQDPEQEVMICGECEDENNEFKYCLECQHYLCEKCYKIHIRSKFTKTHSLVEHWEVNEKKQHDCELCNTPRAAQVYSEQREEFFCEPCSKPHQNVKYTRSHNLISTEGGLIQRPALLKKGERTKSRVQDNGNLDAIHIKQAKIPEQVCPGKPRSSDVIADSITLSWDPPTKFGDGDYYQVSYKDLDHNKKWTVFQDEFKTASALLNNLRSNTAFIFRVRVVNEYAEGPFSEESDRVLTLDSPASRIIHFSLLSEKGNASPAKYALPTTEIKTARNERAKIKKFEYGAPPIINGKSKTVMLVGAYGTGKSTLVDGIVNYILGVNWNDPFRFTVLDLEKEERDTETIHYLSQTKWITCYTINPERGSRLNYQLHIIDTPGFGDALGLNRDQDIVEQIRELVSEREPKGVTFIDAVCFITKAPDARLTVVQRYIFQLIMSLFGRDIETNICSLVTFADGCDPPVLAALRDTGMPFGKSFTFNNSSLFAKNVSIGYKGLSLLFWEMGLKNFRAFFKHLEQLETKSLKVTKDVLDERSRLDATIKNLQAQLDAGLSKVTYLKQKIQIFAGNKSLTATRRFLSPQEQIVEKLGEELSDLMDEIEDVMIVFKSRNECLKKIELISNPLSVTEHIDLMIENEKLEQRVGFQDQIIILNNFRKRAQISKDFEFLSKEAQSTLGAFGKRRNRDTKSLLARS